MSIKAWSSTLLVLCFSFAAWAQNSSRYLEKPLPLGWGTETAHAIFGDDNMFDGQIQPVNDKWWKAFDDPMLDSLIATGIHQELFSSFSHRPHGYGESQLANRTGEFLSFRFLEWWMGTSAK